MKKELSAGFTLIEIMVVVVIISILAMIAYPSYQDSVNKTRRSDAKNALLNAAALQERYFTENNSYWVTDMSNIGGSASKEGYYTLSVANPGTAGCTSGANNYCYTLTATAVGAQLASDTTCRTLVLDHTGNKTSTDSSGTANAANTCW